MTARKTEPASVWEKISRGRAFGLLGILNLTPDSFYDGGKFTSVEKALAQAGKLLEEGANILDLGAESTRPGSEPLSSDEEINRLAPVFFALKKSFPDAMISIDTWHSQTASFFLENGAEIINDVSACAWDEALADVLAKAKPGYVLMHGKGRPASMQANPCYKNVLDEVENFFAQSLDRLVSAGLPKENIVLDPGIGFGKTLAHNLELLANIDKFAVFGCKILAGISMKSWLGNLLGLGINDRGEATAVASALLWQKGVFWHRVHQIGNVRQALELACALGQGRKQGDQHAL